MLLFLFSFLSASVMVHFHAVAFLFPVESKEGFCKSGFVTLWEDRGTFCLAGWWYLMHSQQTLL